MLCIDNGHPGPLRCEGWLEEHWDALYGTIQLHLSYKFLMIATGKKEDDFTILFHHRVRFDDKQPNHHWHVAAPGCLHRCSWHLTKEPEKRY
jgi:hypothetical protein